VWGVESETEWKVTTDKQFVEMVGARIDVKLLYLASEVREKGRSAPAGHNASGRATSGVTAQSIAQSEAADDTAMSP